jgi:phosphatidylglycerol lysyltransferase
MKINPNFQTEHISPQIHKIPFLQENKKIIIQFILTVLFIGLGIWFLRHQHAELVEVRETLSSARKLWIIIGLIGTVLFIALQGLMYYASFASLGHKINLFEAVILYLKRNFISIFLPAGGISSLAFFTTDLEKKGIPKSQIHFASSIYGFISILSVIIISIPAFLFALHEGSIGKADWLGLIALILIFLGLFYTYRSIAKKGLIFRWLLKVFPSVEVFIEDLQLNKINRKFFLLTLLFSILVEVVGIVHIYIAIKALGLTPTILASVMAYLVAVIFLLVSPFLRGLGAIEVSTSFLLTGFGYTDVQAISITFLFRFFEFWIPMLCGIVSFLYKLNRIMMRILPAILIFGLGVVNILSVLKPSLSVRVENLEDILSFDIVNASNYLVLIIGMFLFVTSAFLLKGIRTSWWMALSFTVLSFIGHLVKGIDYTEAIVALGIFIVLLATRKEYTIKHNWKVRSVGIQTALFSILSVLVYSFLGFYFLDKVHFNMHFRWFEIIRYTFLNFIMIGSPDLIPADNFARHFLYSINISGAFSIILLLFVLFRPHAAKLDNRAGEMARAKDLVFQYGLSSPDYFKTYADKLLFFHHSRSAFIAYRISGNYAVALENPVAKDEKIMNETLNGFERYCNENSLRSIYYSISEEGSTNYLGIGKQRILIGYEAEVDLLNFSVNTEKRDFLHKQGYSIYINKPPIAEDLIKKIKSVSDEWLLLTGKEESVFSQGMFIKEELVQHRLVTVETPDRKIVAFLNLIPDYIPGEVVYDLLRVSANAPEGTTDFLLSELFVILKSEGYRSFKLGLAPLTMTQVSTIDGNSQIRFTPEKLRSFIPYRYSREFMQNYNPTWHERYLIYEDDYDLLQLPLVLSKVIIP